MADVASIFKNQVTEVSYSVPNFVTKFALQTNFSGKKGNHISNLLCFSANINSINNLEY